jgi:DNA-binding NtrC family response regulator
MRLGSLAPRVLDVRFVAATNRNLEALVGKGAFREDLYYRLNGMTITIPPLRDRRLQIASLVKTFVAKACEEEGRPSVQVTPQAMRALERSDWPGNVRELRNAIERAVVLAEGGPIDVDVLPDLSARRAPSDLAKDEDPSPEDGVLWDELQSIEKKRILEALERSAGNQSKAAALLGVSRRTLLKRLDAYNVPRPRKQVPPKSRG